MSNPLVSIARVILPAALVYVAYTYLGPAAGVGLLIALALVYLYLNRSIIYQNRAGKKYQKGDFEGVLADLKTAVSSAPKNPKVRGTYAFFLVKMGYTEDAAVEIDKAIECAVTEADKKSLLVTKSLVLWKQRKIDEAIKELEELLITYENTNVYATLGFLYIEKGDYNKALEFNLKARDFNSSSTIILDNLGYTYFLLGDYDNALETYKDVIKNKPNFPEAFYNYARVLEKKGDLEKALYMVRYSLTLRFWNTSTVKKEEVEAYLAELEAKEKAIELEKKENQDTKEPIDNI
ncbi:MAG: tetratricopeptide repeat protein [Clostridiaceae bacterium]|jgi:tetratricopeptide (TPR) repeat protein|nr:tetratricopeptide repeat protein [Clostridiaceae bacterium]